MFLALEVQELIACHDAYGMTVFEMGCYGWVTSANNVNHKDISMFIVEVGGNKIIIISCPSMVILALAWRLPKRLNTSG